MKFQTALKKGLLKKRYKRFFADIEADSEQLTIHVPNTGSLKEVLFKDQPNQPILFTPSHDPKRKLKGTLEAIQTPSGSWVGINTGWPNKVIAELILNSINPLNLKASQNLSQKMLSIKSADTASFIHWKEFSFYKSEVKISNETRLDGMLFKSESELGQKDFVNSEIKKHFIEIKNTTMARIIDGKLHAQFPDGVTERGTKHLETLIELIKKGHTAELIFAIQRNDCDAFSIAEDIDPIYGKTFRKAVNHGLIVTPILLKMNSNEIIATKTKLPLVI